MLYIYVDNKSAIWRCGHAVTQSIAVIMPSWPGPGPERSTRSWPEARNAVYAVAGDRHTPSSPQCI